MLDFIKNRTINRNRYRTVSDAVIISCFFNPQKSQYRSKAFNVFYDSIKHLNHRIVECVIGDAEPEIELTDSITRVYSDSMLWHKESLLNGIIKNLPAKFKYVFWIDADVIFSNLNWLVDSVEQLQLSNILQPFSTCVHLERNELRPSFDVEKFKYMYLPNTYNSKVWHSFCNNYVSTQLWLDERYDAHGHVGFAWGARREVLDKVPLYDKALIGGADHIMAHAAVGQINHPCVTKAFTNTEILHEINEWSREFSKVIDGRVGYVKGNLYHIWHGDLEKRQYLKRIQDFNEHAKNIVDKDSNGLYIANEESCDYVKRYFKKREVSNDDLPYSSRISYTSEHGIINQLDVDTFLDFSKNQDDQSKSELINEFSGFGDGSFGGGGAGGEWGSEDKIEISYDSSSDSSSYDSSSSENYS